MNRALRLLALEGNLDEGFLEHTVANSHAESRIRIKMSHEVLWEPTKNQNQGWESKDEEDMVKEGSEPTGNSAGLSDKDRATMEDSMPKLTKTE